MHLDSISELSHSRTGYSNSGKFRVFHWDRKAQPTFILVLGSFICYLLLLVYYAFRQYQWAEPPLQQLLQLRKNQGLSPGQESSALIYPYAWRFYLLSLTILCILTVWMSRATPAPVTPTQEKSGSFTGIGKLSHHLSLCFEVLFVVSYY